MADYAKLNIYKKMSLATDMINKVAKNLSVGVGQNSYKAVGEADVLAAVKPVEVELGIYSFPYSRVIIDKNEFVTKTEYNGKITEKMNLFERVETVYRFVNVDIPDQYIDITAYGDGIDTQDKSVGKAMTYADKYALLKAYKIETGDDPDQHASKDMGKAKAEAKPRQADPPPEEQKEIDKVNDRAINEIELEALREKSARKGIASVAGRFKKTSDEELIFKEFKEAMGELEVLPDKKKVDLGL